MDDDTYAKIQGLMDVMTLEHRGFEYEMLEDECIIRQADNQAMRAMFQALTYIDIECKIVDGVLQLSG